MNMVTRTIEIDSETDARLNQIAAQRNQDVSAVLAEAVALLDMRVEIEWPDIAEDVRRRDEFLRTRMGVPFDEIKNWVASWGTSNELPRPKPRRIE